MTGCTNVCMAALSVKQQTPCIQPLTSGVPQNTTRFLSPAVCPAAASDALLLLAHRTVPRRAAAAAPLPPPALLAGLSLSIIPVTSGACLDSEGTTWGSRRERSLQPRHVARHAIRASCDLSTCNNTPRFGKSGQACVPTGASATNARFLPQLSNEKNLQCQGLIGPDRLPR